MICRARPVSFALSAISPRRNFPQRMISCAVATWPGAAGGSNFCSGVLTARRGGAATAALGASFANTDVGLPHLLLGTGCELCGATAFGVAVPAMFANAFCRFSCKKVEKFLVMDFSVAPHRRQVWIENKHHSVKHLEFARRQDIGEGSAEFGVKFFFSVVRHVRKNVGRATHLRLCVCCQRE
jgi:hypothetical protein